MKRSKRFGPRAYAGLLTVVASAVAALFMVMSALATSGAAFTTVNDSVDVTATDPGPHCKNGNPAVNCNIYTGKQYVWLNGGPLAASLGDGTYFFAVVAPGGQGGNNDPNDGTPKNLSDTTADPWLPGSLNGDGTTVGSGDDYTNRTFTISNGTISYFGSHNFVDNKIRLMPYDDTPNPGGVYIMAICQIDTPATQGYPVDPKTCKYDAFKVAAGNVCTENCGPGAANDLTIAKTANGSDTKTFTWGIQKDVDKTLVTNSSGSYTFTYTVTVTHDAGTASDWKINGTIDVTNPNLDNSSNPLPVDITSVTDQLSDGTHCSVTNGGAQTLTLADTQFSYECDLNGPPAGGLTNTATVTWPTQFLSDGSVLVGNDAQIVVGNIPFSETLVNDCVTVTDPLGGGTLGTPCASVNASPIVYTYTNTVTAAAGTCTTVDNTATIVETNQTSTQKVKLCVGADLQVTKDAQAAFKRTFHWGITKSVDKTVVRTSGSTATFNYTVRVTHDSGTDSNWVVTGTITVTNPNNWEDITFNLADAVGGNGSCLIAGGGSNLTVLKSSTKQATYTCTYSSAPSPASDTNTATATWDASTYFTPGGSASGTAGFNFGAVSPTLADYCVVVNDPNYSGGTPQGRLGTACNTDASPKTFTYSRTVNVPPNGCATYDNTATFTTNTTGTTGSASQSVKACPTVTGLTMGFWSNKNGQALISGGHATGSPGVCDSGTFLRNYAPFQDLSTTATCSQVASYVYNVIKGGGTTCASATCNAMLKAQMLSTALNVFFGKTNGNEQIDLVHGCSMIDSSSLTGTCGNPENWSAAFGGATHLTVLQMLAYAASQYVSSTNWYGQVKATQVLAKDAFDAINNGVALAF